MTNAVKFAEVFGADIYRDYLSESWWEEEFKPFPHIKRTECDFCSAHEAGDTLYTMSDWDGGIGFDYVRNIKYCPLCSRELEG